MLRHGLKLGQPPKAGDSHGLPQALQEDKLEPDSAGFEAFLESKRLTQGSKASMQMGREPRTCVKPPPPLQPTAQRDPAEREYEEKRGQ